MELKELKITVKNLETEKADIKNESIDYIGYLIFTGLAATISLGIIIANEFFAFDILGNTIFEQSNALIITFVTSSIGFILFKLIKKKVDSKYLIANEEYQTALSELEKMESI